MNCHQKMSDKHKTLRLNRKIWFSCHGNLKVLVKVNKCSCDNMLRKDPVSR